MKQFLILICCFMATTRSRAGLLTGDLSPPTGSSYYSGYGQQQQLFSSGSSYSGDSYNSAGFGAPLAGGFTPLVNAGNPGPYRGSTTSYSHQTQTVPISVPQPYQVTVQHKVPVQVPVPQPVYQPRLVPVEVLQPYPVAVPRPYPVTVAKPVPVPVRQPVYVKVPQAVPVPVDQPYPVHVHKHVSVKVPSQVVVNVPVPVTSGTHGYNHEVGYGSGFGLGAYGQGGYLAGNDYQPSHGSHFSDNLGNLGSGHFAVGAKYTTVSFPASSFHGYSDGYAYKGGFGHGNQLGGGHFGGVETKFTHGLTGGLVDSLRGGHYTDGYKIHGLQGGHFKGGFGGSFGVGASHGHVRVADITIPQQYDANGGYKY